jgi:hypothetical protein
VSDYPVVIGRPAAGLKNAAWASSAGAAKAGTDGELKSAEVLNRIAADVNGPTVIHDVRIPLGGDAYRSCDCFWFDTPIIDSKLWKPAFYWSMFGRSFVVQVFPPREQANHGDGI